MAPNPSDPGKAGVSEGSGVYISTTLEFGAVVMIGFETGKQPVRYTETRKRSPIFRNKSILDLFVISLPIF
jgi:hypothetical protein